MSESEQGRNDLIVVKIGGALCENGETIRSLAGEISALGAGGRYRFVVVHGGGNDVSELTRIFGIEPVFNDGVRMTSAAEMDLVEMALAGKVNKRLVRGLSRGGLRPVGLSGVDGGIFSGRTLDHPETRTGDVERVDTQLLELMVDHGYLPVIASTSADSGGIGVNINADSVALVLAPALRAHALVFLSDVEGILKDGTVMRQVTPEVIEREIHSGTISGGMIPKVRASLGAIDDGVGEVVIGTYGGTGALSRLLNGDAGTVIAASNQRARERVSNQGESP